MIVPSIQEMNAGSLETTHKLEQIECSYWMKYYQGNAVIPTYASIIGDGIMCAIPEVDVLAMNRVIGVGIKHPLDESTIDHINYSY